MQKALSSILHANTEFQLISYCLVAQDCDIYQLQAEMLLSMMQIHQFRSKIDHHSQKEIHHDFQNPAAASDLGARNSPCAESGLFDSSNVKTDELPLFLFPAHLGYSHIYVIPGFKHYRSNYTPRPLYMKNNLSFPESDTSKGW